MFAHGAGGAVLARLAGEPVVIKAWPRTAERERRVSTGLAHAAIMAERSVPVPPLIERGTLGDDSYLIHRFVDGEWPAVVDGVLATELLSVVDRQRDAAPSADPGWPDDLATMITDGDVSLDIRPERLRDHRQGRTILQNAEHALADCPRRLLRCTDIVHGDFAPENVLVADGRITAVIDWEQSRVGDAGFDLAGLIHDIVIGDKADAGVLAELQRAIEARVPDAAWRLYTAMYAVRYASWSIGTAMEPEVLATIRTVADGGWGGRSPR